VSYRDLRSPPETNICQIKSKLFQFIDDDLTQVLDAVFGEGGHAILTRAVNPEAAVLGNMSIDSSSSQSSSWPGRLVT
jgi:hypothetical protein